MRNYKNYIKREKESKVYTVIACLIMIAIIVLVVLQFCGIFTEPLWEPDGSYPLVNANVSWQQTYHGGAF